MKFTLAVLAFAAPVLAAEESTTAEKEPTKWSGIPKVDLTLWYLNGSYQTVVNAQGTVELELLTVVHGPAQNDGYQIGTYSQLVNPAKVDDVEMYETSIAFTEWKKENKKPLAASTVKFLSAYDATKLNKNWFNDKKVPQIFTQTFTDSTTKGPFSKLVLEKSELEFFPDYTPPHSQTTSVWTRAFDAPSFTVKAGDKIAWYSGFSAKTGIDVAANYAAGDSSMMEIVVADAATALTAAAALIASALAF